VSMDVIEPQAPQERPESPQYASEATLGKDPRAISLESYFDIAHPNVKEQEILNDMIRMIGATDQTDMLYTLQQLEAQAGYPPLGVSRMQHLHNFAKLKHQMQITAKQLQQYGA